MKNSVEILEDGRAKLTVVVEAAEVDECLTKVYKQFAQRYNFPGFRKGKAPRAVIDNALGKDAAAAVVTDELIEKYAPIAVDESGISPVGEADFSGADSLVAKGQDFEFSFTMAQRAEVELSSYEPVDIEIPSEGVSEAELNEQMELSLDYYAEYSPAAEDAKVANGNRVTMDLAAKDDADKEIDTLTSEAFRYTLGGGLFPATFDEKIIGLGVGEKIEFEMPMPEVPTTYLTGLVGLTQNVKFAVEIKSIEDKSLPELTDEWVEENIGFASLAEYRERLETMISEQKQKMIPQIKENRALMVLLERLEGEIPESMAEEAEANLLQDFFKQLQDRGTSFDAYLTQRNITSEQFSADIKQQAKDMAGQDLALSAWAKHFGITATPEEVTAEFVNSGVEDPAALEENWRQAGRLHMVRDGVVRTKALDDILEKANIVVVEA